MKYVSRIVDEHSDRVVSLFSCSIGSSKLFISESGVEYPWSDLDICVGIAQENNIAIRYKESELEILKYIKAVHSVKSAQDGGEGFCRSICSLLDDPDENVCLVSAPDEVFMVMGYKNAVVKVLRNYCSLVDYITVAAWLGHLCRVIGCFIFDKQFLYIEGALENRIVLELDTSVEAKKYFTRLYMLGRRLW